MKTTRILGYLRQLFVFMFCANIVPLALLNKLNNIKIYYIICYILKSY